MHEAHDISDISVRVGGVSVAGRVSHLNINLN